MKVLGGKAIISTLEKIADGTAPRKKQPEDFTMAPMIQKEMGAIDWNKSSEEIRNQIRGFNPMPGAYSELGSVRVKIWMAEKMPEVSSEIVPGTILYKDTKNGLVIKTGDGALKITEIQFPNLKKMSPEDYLRGHQILVDSFLS